MKKMLNRDVNSPITASDIKECCLDKAVPVSLTPEETKNLLARGSVKTANGVTVTAYYPTCEALKNLEKFYDIEQYKQEVKEAINHLGVISDVLMPGCGGESEAVCSVRNDRERILKELGLWLC